MQAAQWKAPWRIMFRTVEDRFIPELFLFAKSIDCTGCTVKSIIRETRINTPRDLKNA